MKLTSRDRLMRLFRGEEVDRPALKLWGAGLPGPQLHPAYQPVSDLALQTSDLFENASSPFDVLCGIHQEEIVEAEIRPTGDPLWLDRHTTYHTPKGTLHSVDRISTVGEPSYTMEYAVKEPADLEKLLSLPYTPFPFDASTYFAKQKALGDRGVVTFSLDHAGHALHRLAGSETLALFSVDCRDEMTAVLEVFSARIREHARAALQNGVTGPFAWVGPEVYIPPLLSPRDFEDFVFRFDAPLCADIHSGGSYVWVHCHGKVASFLERYIAMGVDILNPLEPPKNGDIDMAQTVERVGGRIGLEGNIEIQEILQAGPERLMELIETCVQAGSRSGRFLLCPSAGYMEYPFPTAQYIDNLLLYLRFGLECVERCRT